MNKPVTFEDFAGLPDITVVDAGSVETALWPAFEPEEILEGDPAHRGKVLFRDPSGRFSVGTWVCPPSKFTVDYEGIETGHVIRGRARLTNRDTGHTVEIKAGDQFIMPFQAKITWEVLEEFQKLYVMYEDEYDPSHRFY